MLSELSIERDAYIEKWTNSLVFTMYRPHFPLFDRWKTFCETSPAMRHSINRDLWNVCKITFDLIVLNIDLNINHIIKKSNCTLCSDTLGFRYYV